MVDELAKIIAKNSSDIQDLQVGETPEELIKFVDFTESLSGTETLTARKRIVGTEFILDKSTLVSGGGTSADRLLGIGSNLPQIGYQAGLLALYNFNESTPIAPIDQSVNANNAIAISGTTVAESRDNFMSARDFNGSTDMINLGNPASLNLGNGSNFTIEFWANPTRNNTWTCQVISKGAVGARTLDIGLNNSTTTETAIYLVTNAGAVSLAYGTAQSGNWIHYAYTYDAAFLKIWKNGECVASGAQTGSVTPTGSDWVIGNFSDRPANYWFKGRIDDLAIYNYAKTSFPNYPYQASGASGWAAVTL
jgi:hypothetical protein